MARASEWSALLAAGGVSSSDFVDLVEKNLVHEQIKIGRYLNENCLFKFENVIVERTLEKSLHMVLDNPSSGFMSLLKNKEQYHDLKKMFSSFARVQSGLGINAMSEIFRKYIRELSLGGDKFG